jgi:hypothetical protein
MQVKAVQEGRIKLFWRNGLPEGYKRQLGMAEVGLPSIEIFTLLKAPSVLFLLFVGLRCFGSLG